MTYITEKLGLNENQETFLEDLQRLRGQNTRKI